MADKTIADLPAISSVGELNLFAVDDGAQTFKATLTQVRDGLGDPDMSDVMSEDDFDVTDNIVKIVPLGQQLSSSCGAYSSAGTTYTDVTNLSVTITTDGKPVRAALQYDQNGTEGLYPRIFCSGTGRAHVRIIDNNGIVVAYMRYHPDTNNLSCSTDIEGIYHPAAGTYTLKCQIRNEGTDAISIWYSKLIAYQLK